MKENEEEPNDILMTYCYCMRRFYSIKKDKSKYRKNIYAWIK